MYIDFYVKISIKTEMSRQIFEKCSNIKFNENPNSWSRFVPHGRTDMSNLTVAFRDRANAPKKHLKYIKKCNYISK